MPNDPAFTVCERDDLTGDDRWQQMMMPDFAKCSGWLRKVVTARKIWYNKDSYSSGGQCSNTPAVTPERVGSRCLRSVPFPVSVNNAAKSFLQAKRGSAVKVRDAIARITVGAMGCEPNARAQKILCGALRCCRPAAGDGRATSGSGAMGCSVLQGRIAAHIRSRTKYSRVRYPKVVNSTISAAIAGAATPNILSLFLTLSMLLVAWRRLPLLLAPVIAGADTTGRPKTHTPTRKQADGIAANVGAPNARRLLNEAISEKSFRNQGTAYIVRVEEDGSRNIWRSVPPQIFRFVASVGTDEEGRKVVAEDFETTPAPATKERE